ncbi:MAG: late competence development ComFB family protein [Tissierellales bacterium]|nr:late competence development ComFB family protein [Tissierellales bacterium]
MRLHNHMEDLVLSYVDKLLPKFDGICDCDKCRLDIAAIALNNLPGMYSVTEIGEVYSKIKEMETQYVADVIKEVTRAAEIVSLRPEHKE